VGVDVGLVGALESERLFSLLGSRGCATTFDSYRQLLTHCRQQHPDTPPGEGDPTPELVMTDTRGMALSWEEVHRIVEHPLFWRRPHGIVLPGEERACR